MSQIASDSLAFFRTVIFYGGYVTVTILMSTLLILIFPVLSEKSVYRLCTAWCSFVLFWLSFCCGVRCKIEGLSNIPTSPCVVVANHQSSWETIFFYKLIFPVSPILKKELLKIPFWGWALRIIRPIAIDRSKPKEAGRSLLLQGIAKLKRGYSIILFPEGSRKHPGEVGKFSRSAAKLAIDAGVQIVPISHNAGYCWPPHSFIKRPGLITVCIGKGIETGQRNDKQLTDELRDWIQDHTVVKH